MADYLQIKTDQRGFFPVENDIIDNTSLLNTNEKLVYIVLLRYGDRVFPSVSTIAKQSGMSRATATRTLDSLVEKGLVQKQARKRKDGGKDSNLYSVFNTREIWASKTLEEVNAAINMTELEKAKRLLESAGYVVADVPPQTAPQTPSKPTTGKATTKATRKAKTAPKAVQTPVDGIAMANTAYALVTGEKRKANTIAVPITVTEE